MNGCNNENEIKSIDLSPEEFRQLGHHAIDLLAKQLSGIFDAPVRRPVPEELRETLLNQPLPQVGKGASDLLNEIAERILSYPLGNLSPRFFSRINATPAPMAILADLLASGMNSNASGGDHAATYVEYKALDWLKELLQYPRESGGVLASGGSVSNLLALSVMRSIMAEGDLRKEGLQGETTRMVVYASTEVHSCIEKAVELLGLGNRYLHKIPVDADYRMDVNALRSQIARDRNVGLRPVCIVANAGTVNTGAIDPLDTLADLCQQENLWYHVDGAYGGFGILAEQTQGLYQGMERADSLAVDPHKWLYLPFECGCVFVKNAEAMRHTFRLVPPYLVEDRTIPWFSDQGIQLSRNFKALKVWTTLQQVGSEGYKSLISGNISLARKLQERIQRRPDFQLIAAGPLSVICFRYAPPQVTNLDFLNRSLLEVVNAGGKAMLGSTELHGQLVLRACIVNFRTRESDLDLLLEAIVEAGQDVLRR